jgi:hypothetical protein
VDPVSDFFAAELPLLERLKAKVPTAATVVSGVDMAGLQKMPFALPAIYVMFNEYRVTQQQILTGKVQVEEVWLIVVAARNLVTAQTGLTARQEAGPLLAQIIQAISGWMPEDSLYESPFKLIQGAPRWWYHDGLLHYPLAFSILVPFSGEP